MEQVHGQTFIHRINPTGHGKAKTVPGTGQWQLLSLSQKCPHIAPRGLGTKLRMPYAMVCLFHPYPTPLPIPIQDSTGRRDGRVDRKYWALGPDKGQGWAESICFEA